MTRYFLGNSPSSRIEKKEIKVIIPDGAVDVVEVEAVDGVGALDAALPKLKAGGAAVAVEVASVVLAVSSALLAVADEDPKEKEAPLVVRSGH